PWCLVNHLLGMIACANVLKAVGLSPGPLPHSRLPPGTLLGLAVVGGFIGLQFLTTSSASPAIVNARMIQSPVDPSDGLTVTLAQGTVTIDRTACTMTGPAEAPEQLLVLFDYCCPHCR